VLWSSETDESFPDKRWKTEDHFELIRETFERTTEATSVSGLVWHTADCCWWGDWWMEIKSLGSCPYKWVAFWTFIVISDIASRLLTFNTKQLNISWQLWHIMFHLKISGNAPFFSLLLFVFVHIPPIFSVLLTYSLEINSLLFLTRPAALYI